MTNDLRSPTEHDADRIVYSSAYRRLAGVTQVVAVEETALFHNRLTHTMKVAQLARRLAEDLVRPDPEDPGREDRLKTFGGIDPPAAEAAALAHDLGHPPFGHVAEDELRRKCDEIGLDGFEGNAQTFRIVTKLARRGGANPGLGLQPRTLHAILKYPWLRKDLPAGKDLDDCTAEEKHPHLKFGAYGTEEPDFLTALAGDDSEQQSPEAVLMDWCDDISYALHDLEDFYRAGLVPLERLAGLEEERSWFLANAFHELGKRPPFEPDEARTAFKRVRDLLPDLPYRGLDEDRESVHTRTSKLIEIYFDAVTTHEAAPHVRIPKTARYQVNLLKQLTWQYVVNNPALASVQEGQVRLIGSLFDDLTRWLEREQKNKTPHRLPPRLAEWYRNAENDHRAMDMLTDDQRRGRTVADYICSLTEAQAVNLFERLSGRSRQSVLEGWVRL